MPAKPGLWQEISVALAADPFLLAGALVFIAAVLHAFACPAISRRLPPIVGKGGFRHSAWHLLGEIEMAFVLWSLFLLGLMAGWPGKGLDFALRYAATGDYLAPIASGPSKYVEPMFVFVIMVMAASEPVTDLAAGLLGRVARLFGGSPRAHWFVVLSLAPMLGSLITEPAAMTIAAMLLSARFFRLRPSEPLRYATLALLFTNISVGGALTHFAAPPIVMVASKWGWGLKEVFARFGVAAFASILLSTSLYLVWFRRELAALSPSSGEAESRKPIPSWIVAVHLACMVWAVLMLREHRLTMLAGVLLVFLLFVAATSRWQSMPGLRAPLLVGLFLSGLVLLGGVQGWWIAPVLGRMGECSLLIVSTALTSFNDNAAVTYLASQVPLFAEPGPLADGLRHALLAGALAGGGLTVIANAPNPAGQSVLAVWFEEGVSAWRLFLWALPPALVALGCFVWVR